MKSTLAAILIVFSFAINAQTVSGELQRWHKVTLSFTGPNSSESANPNPFTDYRLDVTFTNGSSSYTIPGYYAGCENAQDSGCNSGNVWKVHFSPGKTGTWNWTASFKSGDDIAIKSGGSSAGFMDGDTGSFNIAESNKSGRDHRAKDKGMLQYVGEHYLRYSGTNPENPNGDWFVKAGADSPENAFNYVDFDATPNYKNTLNKVGSKTWQPHQQDYVASDASSYTWGNGKGTEILGMINYLSGEGANVLSFLTWNTNGDGGAVFPHTLSVSLNEYGNTGQGQQWNKVNKDRFDVSKLAQWEKVMEYADKKGMYLHFKTMETENDNLMDGDNFGRQRKLYYRELIARFSHHLAMNWNLTEETTLKDAVAIATASYIKDLDPYDHNIVIHTYPNQHDLKYDPLLGNKSDLTGASIQTDKTKVHNDVRKWLEKSRNAGKKWIVANDEQGSAGEGVRVSDKRIRDEVLWGTLLAGGAGVEYYSGYTDDDGDINGNDHRKRGDKYKDGGHALAFFNNYLQSYMIDMVSSDGVTSDGNDYVFAKAGEVYAIYRPNGGTTAITVQGANNGYKVQWYNPRAGGALTAAQTLGNNLTAPDSTNDWVALVLKDGTTPPPSGGPDGYTFATDEDGTVNVTGTVDIAYGANGTFTFLRNVSSDTPCNNNAFGGDPIPNVKKSCYIKQVSTTPSNCDYDLEEKNGLAVIEIERLDISGTAWEFSTAKSGFSGDNYIEWTGSDNFNNPGAGIISAKIKINTPGKYRFQWRSRVGEGTNPTEANDSWLKIPDADDFFGESNGDKVYPKGSGKTPIAEGASADGWMKVYLNGTTEWTWRSSTNDNDPHQVFAEFDNAGIYTIQISGRSKHHLIDRIVMYNPSVTEANATNLNQSETLADCQLSTNPFDAIKEQLFVTPNPAQNEIAINGLNINANATIYNLLGKQVFSNIALEANVSKKINIDQLPAGMYFLRLQDKEGNAAAAIKFLKK